MFYNRVLLPEYITEELTWQQLKKIKNAELDNLDINIHPETTIENIDKEHKKVTDSKGEIHTFDTLILATGSRPFIPKDVQIELPGRFTMRNKSDADSFKKYLEDTGLPPEEQHVVIVGGGLLGLELAAAMKHKNVKITIVQRASRLMERQLDKISSKLLSLDVQERGIQIYFDNEVSTVFDDEDTGELTINLKSGKYITANAIVYAIGTRPNIEIAKNNGIICGRGVKVNQHLQSSHPAILRLAK